MLTAILLAVTFGAELSPSLPAGSNPDLHRAFQLVSADLEKSQFDRAKAKLKLVPQEQVTFVWNDLNVPVASRKEFAEVRTEALRMLSSRIPGLKFKVGSGPVGIKFSFEKVLANDPGSGLPRGIALFFSEDLTEPRMEAVIGLQRGNPTEKTSQISLYNEIVFAVASYLGLAPGPYLGTASGRVNLQMYVQSNPDINELTAINSIRSAVNILKLAVEQRKVLTPAFPKVSFNPESIERGPVIQGTPMEFSVQVSNLGNAPVQFRVIPDCGCVTAKLTPPIAPGSTMAVPLKVDTKDIVGELNRHLILVSNDSTNPVLRFPIRIKATPRYRFLTNEANILIVDNKVLETELFLVSPKEKLLEATSVEVSGGQGTATLEPWQGNMADPTLNEASKLRYGYKIKLRLNEPIVSGRAAATVTVATSDPSFATVKHVVFMQKGISAMPASVFYGDLSRAEREATFILTRPNKPFKVVKIESDSSFVTGSATSTNENWEYKIFVRYNGKAPPGDMRATLTIFTDDPKQAKMRIPVIGNVR